MERSATDGKTVFVVHGRNLTLRDAIFTFLRQLGLHPLEWSEAVHLTGQGSPYIGDVLKTAFHAAQAVVVILTPDEVAYLRPDYAQGAGDRDTEPAMQARPNVLFEAGMAFGADADRTILVEIGDLRPFSDIAGRHAVRLDGSALQLEELADRLKSAGCFVDLSGTDWLDGSKLLPPKASDLPLGRRLPASPAPKIRVDAKYSDGIGGNQRRLHIINQGSVDLFDVSIELPADVQNFQVLDQNLPVRKLPAGKSVSLPATRWMGPGPSNFEAVLSGVDASGEAFTESVFIDLGG